MNRPRPLSVVELANEQVPITAVCRLVGVDLDDDIGYGRSIKLHCPFGVFHHSDGGAEAAMRVYPESNHAFCFAGCGHFSPVWLLAHARGIHPRVAAAELLERIGYRPPNLRERWAYACRRDEPPDRTLLAEALKTFCARVDPHWGTRQFSPAVATTLTRCLALLDLVGTETDAEQWLLGCKTVMSRLLHAGGLRSSPVAVDYR